MDELQAFGNYPGGSALDLGITVETGGQITLKIEKLGAFTNTIG